MSIHFGNTEGIGGEACRPDGIALPTILAKWLFTQGEGQERTWGKVMHQPISGENFSFFLTLPSESSQASIITEFELWPSVYLTAVFAYLASWQKENERLNQN